MNEHNIIIFAFNDIHQKEKKVKTEEDVVFIQKYIAKLIKKFPVED